MPEEDNNEDSNSKEMRCFKKLVIEMSKFRQLLYSSSTCFMAYLIIL